MFGLGMSEIILLGVLALIVIGPKQLPEVARTLGRFINELKRSTEEFTDEIKQQAKVDLDLEKHLNVPKIDSPDEYLKHIQAPEAEASEQMSFEDQSKNKKER